MTENEFDMVPHTRCQLYLLLTSKCTNSPAHPKGVTCHQSLQHLSWSHLPRSTTALLSVKSISPLRLCLPRFYSSVTLVWRVYSQLYSRRSESICLWRTAMMQCLSLPIDVTFSPLHGHSNVSISGPASHLQEISNWALVTLAIGRFATAVQLDSSGSTALKLLYSNLCHIGDGLNIALTFFTWQMGNPLMIMATALIEETSKWRSQLQTSTMASPRSTC